MKSCSLSLIFYQLLPAPPPPEDPPLLEDELLLDEEELLLRLEEDDEELLLGLGIFEITKSSCSLFPQCAQVEILRPSPSLTVVALRMVLVLLKARVLK